MLLLEEPEEKTFCTETLKEICNDSIYWLLFLVALETTIFTFKISVPFEEWARGFDSPDVDAMHKANKVTPLYRGVSKDDPQSVVVVHQAEEGVAKAMFEGAREPIEAGGHIWDSTVITSYLAD